MDCAEQAYKQAFSSDNGRSWGSLSLMTGRTVPPHSVLPTLHQLAGGRGYLLSGGRGGFYLWHCADITCIDEGLWTATNLGAHHNTAASSEPSAALRTYPPECVSDRNWDHSLTGAGLGACPSKAYIGLIPLQEAGAFMTCCKFTSNPQLLVALQ